LVVRADCRSAAQLRTDWNAWMTRATGTLIKFTAFALVMTILTAFLFLIFSQTETGRRMVLCGGLHRRVTTQDGRYRAGRREFGSAPSRVCR
jgi:ribose/xylose/arabinose/galactoside ABC-type transport system permease subunit